TSDAGRPGRAGAGSFGHQPALDGVRAVAVAAVLLFHGGVGWMTGGYIGVSVFFTLSGFLITSLLLREVDAHGRVDVGAFYARRARRLLPASALCLTAIVVAAWLGAFEGVANLRRDVLGALAQVANWTQLLSGESYGDLLQAQAGQVSPLDHFWSLAIEEQFYWLWPLGMGWLARRRRVGGWSGSVGALTVAAAVAAPLVAWRWGPDAAYWATPARASEILAGAALACLCFEGRLVRVPRGLAPLCLGALVAAAVVLPAASGFAYSGGFPVIALASAGLLYGLQAPGPVRTVLSLSPLVWLGRISYGVYLYHWPIYAWLDETSTGLTGPALLALRLGVTLTLSAASFALVERPVRLRRSRPSRTLAWAVPAVAVVAILAVALAPHVSVDYGPSTAAAAQVAPDPVPPRARLAPVVVQDATPSRPVRMTILGDSTSMALGAGMVEWARVHPELAQVSVRAAQGCGFVRSGVVPTDPAHGWPEDCDRIFATLSADLVRDRPDVVVLNVTARDIDPRSWDGGPLLTLRDPEHRAHVAADYRALTDEILRLTPATVVWVRPLAADPYWNGDPEHFHNPEMHGWLDQVRAEVVAGYADRVELLDLRAWAERTGVADDREARPDGIHFAVDAAAEVTTTWLGPQL
ncbi:MAG: acyltransferase family protein, partial [Acidimicrobiales bacterium]